MARGINKVILVGNLGNDPETSYTQGGTPVCKFSLATTSVRNDRDGNRQEKTEWHRITFFGKVAEIAGEYLKKGRQVYVEGRIEYGSYEKDGIKHYTTDIIGNDMQMLGGEGGGQRSGGGEGAPSSGYSQRSGGGGYGGDRPQRAPAQRRDPAPAKPANFDDVPFDDDIPF